MTLTDPDMIRQFIAENGKYDVSPDRQDVYNYLAVDTVDISCHFYEDFGKIRLIDTCVIQNYADLTGFDNNNCDAVIIVTRPVSGVDYNHIERYNFLRRKFRNWNWRTDKRLFYAANLHRGNNDRVAHDFERSINGGNFDICFCKVVKCSDKEAVSEDFLRPMLKELTEHLREDDVKQFEKLQTEFKKLRDKCERM